MMSVVAVSVIVPVFNSQKSLEPLVRRISVALSNVDHEIILVDDGSIKPSWATIQDLASEDSRVSGIRLGRNYGQHAALVAGVRKAVYPVTVTIDDDLQNPPEEIPRLLAALDDSTFDVVYGVPESPTHSWWRQFASRFVRKVMNSALKLDGEVHFSSFRAFRTDLRDAFGTNLGPGVSLDALLAWGTNSFGAVSVVHDKRSEGKSQYSIRKLWSFAIDVITGYSAVPLKVTSALGFLTSLVGLVLMIIFVLVPFARGLSIQGFPFLASTIILFSGVQLVTLGVIGEYLARMHFRVMRKPEYFVAEAISHKGGGTL